jgi:hypothetical protein
MISRRSFLKLSGLAAVATGAGFGTGSLLTRGETRRFSMHAFVPGDERLLRDMLQMFSAEIPSGSSIQAIDADSQWSTVIRSALRRRTFSAGADHGTGQVRVRMQRLGAPVQGDILLSDDRKRIYDPAGHFTTTLHTLRGSLKASEAQYMISAEYVESPAMASLFSSGSVLVVEHDRGLYDRIPLDGKTRHIDIPGAHGRTGVTITAAGAHVHASSCRHGVCRKTGMASHPGDVIACAPNRVLLRIEHA